MIHDWIEPLNLNQSVSQPDFSDCATQRQVETKMVRKALNDFADAFPAAGAVLTSLGDKALDLLTSRILEALHPRAVDMYSDVTRTLYDLPFGTSI